MTRTEFVPNMKTPELIAGILKQGGKLLIVGGETKDLPKPYQEHPQIVIWDDNKQMFSQKSIPNNVKIIMWNRWVSHDTTARLNQAVKDLRALKFANLRTREIKELLAEVIQTDAPEVPFEVIEKEIETVNTMTEQPIGKKGFLKEFVAKHINLSADFSAKGTLTKEGKRLYQIAKDEKLKTTELSVIQAVGVVIRELKRSKGTTPRKSDVVSLASKVRQTKDDFEHLNVLIQDAIAAMKLVQEHLPKVRKETERLRSLKDKMLRILE